MNRKNDQNDQNDYTVTFKLYSPYGGRSDLGLIGKKGEEVKRYPFQQISGITALSLTYNGKDGTLTDTKNGESIQFNTTVGGPVYTTEGDSPPSQRKTTYLIGPFLTEYTSVQLAIL